jgi:hypothetical protein
METTNNNIKIVRLQSGEDVICNYYADEENGQVLLGDPMHLIFKRMPTGKTVMVMMPWLPMEIIKDNSALIYDSDILTIVDPKDELIHYYNQNVFYSLEAAEGNSLAEQLLEDDDEDDDEDEDADMKVEELMEILQERKKNNLH